MATTVLIVRSCVVSMFVLILVWTSRVITTYWRALRTAPTSHRALPEHVLLVTAGTLILSGTLTAIIYRNAGEGRPVSWYLVATFIGDALILAALILLDQWQTRRKNQ